MNIFRCLTALVVLVVFGCATATNSPTTSANRGGSAPALTVTQITNNGQSVTSAADVVVRALDGQVSQQGVHEGEVLKDEARVEVPAHESVTITAPGGSRVTLEPGAIDTFHYTGSVENVVANAGKIDLVDALDFYHVSGQGFDALAQGTVYSVDVTSESISFNCTSGRVATTEVGTTAAELEQSEQAAIERVDMVDAAGRRSVTYHFGLESAADVSAMVRADRAAANAGDTSAEFNLGARYDFGRGVPENDETAVHWYRLATAKGFAVAENNLGEMYEFARGGPFDQAQALHLLRLAAAQGLAAAENNLGYMYYIGLGVPRNPATALHWYELAAAQGLAAAENNIAEYYEEKGLVEGLPEAHNKDYAAALHWYELAAAQGLAPAEYNLGNAYRSGGLGVSQNYRTALYWYQLAVNAHPGLHSFSWAYSELSALSIADMYAMGGASIAANRGRAFGWILIANALGGNLPRGRGEDHTAMDLIATASAAEQTEGRAFALRFVTGYASRTGTRLSLPSRPS